MLHEIVARDGCNLSQEYTKVTANTRIAFTCGTANCQHTHDKALDKMRVSGGFCKVCTDKRKLDKAKATSLLIYGVENPSQCPGIKAQIAQTFMQKYGTTTPQCLEEQKAKARQTNLLKYGVENPFQAEVCKEKGRRTMVNKYGAPNPQQCAAIKAKTKSTMRMRYGVDNPMQNAEVQKKGKATNMFKYGVENPFQANECKEKSKQTCLNKYGTEYAAQSEIFKEKVQQVCMKKYGVRSPSQHPDILDKQFKSACKLKDYPFPCGKVVQVQGYEPFALNDLVSLGYTAHDIVQKYGTKKMASSVGTIVTCSYQLRTR